MAAAQRMADDTRAEVESHRTQDGRAELKETRLAAGAAEEREDGRRKEFAADLVPREGGFFEDPHPSALTHGEVCIVGGATTMADNKVQVAVSIQVHHDRRVRSGFGGEHLPVGERTVAIASQDLDLSSDESANPRDHEGAPAESAGWLGRSCRSLVDYRQRIRPSLKPATGVLEPEPVCALR